MPAPPDPTRPTGPDREPTQLPAGDSPWGLPPEADTPAWAPYPAGAGAPHHSTPSHPSHPSTPHPVAQPPPAAPHGAPPGRGGTNPALVVALVATAIVLVVGLVTGGVLISRSGDDDTAGGSTRQPSSAPPSTRASEPGEPSSEPSSEPPVEPSEPASPETTDPPAVPASGAFKYQEFGGDWKFRLGDVSLFATFRRGWNYRSCAPVEAERGSLTGLGCRRAASWTYRALEGHLALTHVVLTMRDGAAAKKAAEGGLAAEDWKVDPAGWLEGVDGGTWEADAQGSFVVLTVETHEAPVRKAKADEFRSYANSDITAALIFRG